MATTVTSIVQQARDKHPAFNDNSIPDKLALGAISRLERKLISRGADVAPDLFVVNNLSSKQTVGDNPTKSAGYTLPEALKFTEFYVLYTDNSIKELTIIPADMSPELFATPAATIRGKIVSNAPVRALFPIDPDEKDWAGADIRLGWEDASKIIWHYVPMPSVYSAFASSGTAINVVIPDSGVFALVDALADWMAKRLTDQVGNAVVGVMAADARESLDTWLTELDQFGEQQTRYVHWKSF